MTALNATAKATLRDYGVSQAEWVRNHFSGGKWLGDACGCPDDRCIGFHHDGPDDCGCLPAVLEHPERWRRPVTAVDQAAAGPFETMQQASAAPQVRRAKAEARLACDARDQITRLTRETDPDAAQRVAAAQRAVEAPNLAILTGACEAAGVELGAYDRRTMAWLAGWEAEVCAVIAGLITRAAASTGDAGR